MTDIENSMKRIIITGGGTLQVPIIRKAASMGLQSIVFDMDTDAPGKEYCWRFVQMSTRDIDGCVREAKRIALEMPIHGVITAGTDASRAVSAIAAALDLPGIRYTDAEAASNKVLMRKRLRKSGVPIPDFYPVWNLKEARDALDELGAQRLRHVEAEHLAQRARHPEHRGEGADDRHDEDLLPGEEEPIQV